MKPDNKDESRICFDDGLELYYLNKPTILNGKTYHYYLVFEDKKFFFEWYKEAKDMFTSLKGM